MIDEWRTIEKPGPGGLGLPRERLALASRFGGSKVIRVLRIPGNDVKRRSHDMPLDWRTIGLPGGRGIGRARKSIDGTCKLVGVGVGVEGSLSVADTGKVEGGR